MKNRKSIMTASALMILAFHLWVSLFAGNKIEAFIRQTTYVGVDMFFFISAYSISNREVTNYGSFILSRFKAVYLKFIFFAVVAFFFADWKFSYLLSVVSGIDLLAKGGGAFLWFLPAIMLFYLLLPLYQKFDKKNRMLALSLVILGWFCIGFVFSKFTNYRAMFIYWNRIPAILAGFYAAKIMESDNNKITSLHKVFLGVILLAVGTFIVYKWGYKPALQVPLRDMFYVLALPSVLGLIMLIDLIPECRLTKLIGSATLELYAVQMIFGYRFSNMLVKAWYGKLANRPFNNFLINLCSTVFLIVLAVVINQLWTQARKFITKKDK